MSFGEEIATQPFPVTTPLEKNSPLQREDESFESSRASVHTVNQESPSIDVDEVNETEDPSALQPKHRRKVFILSLDGGGMRGLIAARIICRLEELIKERTGETEVNLCDYFDFIAGTSTGALLTVMLTTPDKTGKPLMNGTQCCEFYGLNGPQIFLKRRHPLGPLFQIWRPKYSHRGMENVVKKYLTPAKGKKHLTLKDSLTPVLMTGFDISRAAPYFFTQTAANKDDSHDFRLEDLCRGVSAAPTFFPPHRLESVDKKNSITLIDGGVIQNNPSLVALTHVLGHKELYPEAKTIEDIMLLSLGAGQTDQMISLEKSKRWGRVEWLVPLLNIMMDGASDSIDYQIGTAFAGQLCSSNYLRIQLYDLPNHTSELDNASEENLNDLIMATNELLGKKALQRNEYGEKEASDMTNEKCLSKFADELVNERKIRQRRSNRMNFETSIKSLERDEKEKEKLKAKDRISINGVVKIITSPFAKLLERRQSKNFNRSVSMI